VQKIIIQGDVWLGGGLQMKISGTKATFYQPKSFKNPLFHLFLIYIQASIIKISKLPFPLRPLFVYTIGQNFLWISTFHPSSSILPVLFLPAFTQCFKSPPHHQGRIVDLYADGPGQCIRVSDNLIIGGEPEEKKK
jgi:hypothetical protein